MCHQYYKKFIVLAFPRLWLILTPQCSLTEKQDFNDALQRKYS
jgi:hypothetical protein